MTRRCAGKSSRAFKVGAAVYMLVCLLAIIPRSSLAATEIGGYKFIGSIDTMKLSKDQASAGFTTSDAQAVDLASTMAVTHITVNTPLEYPSVTLAWANRIHQDGKHVWFRLNSINGRGLAHADARRGVHYRPPYDGYPDFGPGYLTTLHDVMLAYPGLVKPGDILDGGAEIENSAWWKKNYGCGVQQGCTPCPDITLMTAASRPCAPVSELNRFLQIMTTQENKDLASLGISACSTLTSKNCVLTQVHSTDPGTATQQLSTATVRAMGNLITVDAFPDQDTTSPATAASAWVQSLQSWRSAWTSRGINVTVLVGEWGYSNAKNVNDATQEAIINAEVTNAFPTIPYLAGTSYWVGPGSSSAGGFTNIFIQDSAGVWKFRPAANDVSRFYAKMYALK